MNQGEADRILFNGTIITVDSANTVAEAVAVKDGKIAAVGTEHDVMRWRGMGTKLTDLGGKTALPGFVEPHSHLSFVGVKLNVANLSPPPIGPVGSLADLKQALRDYRESKDLMPGGWVIGMGYDDTAMAEQRHPVREDLDEVSVAQLDHHLALVEKAAHQRRVVGTHLLDDAELLEPVDLAGERQIDLPHAALGQGLEQDVLPEGDGEGPIHQAKHIKLNIFPRALCRGPRDEPFLFHFRRPVLTGQGFKRRLPSTPSAWLARIYWFIRFRAAARLRLASG